ncbi:2OG-Fe(II) oxygenase [Larkinella harenae]
MIKEYLQTERVLVIDSFLSVETCAALVETLLSSPFEESQTVNSTTHQAQKTDFRTSKTLFPHRFPLEVSTELLRVESQIEELLGIESDRWEGWQLNRYDETNVFKAHYDTGLKTNKDNERQYTVLLTLQEPQSGGRTEFPTLERAYPAVAGRLVMWDNLDADGQPSRDMIHTGAPVEQGVKIAAVNWIHAKPYRR